MLTIALLSNFVQVQASEETFLIYKFEWILDLPQKVFMALTTVNTQRQKSFKSAPAATSSAFTFDSVCHLMKNLSGKKNLLTIFIGLGDCASLFNPTGFEF